MPDDATSALHALPLVLVRQRANRQARGVSSGVSAARKKTPESRLHRPRRAGVTRPRSRLPNRFAAPVNVDAEQQIG